MYRSPFARLTAKVRQAILSEMPDIATLEAAMKADYSLRLACSGNVSLILERVVTNEIGPGLLPEALAVFESSHLESYTTSDILKVMQDYSSKSTTQPEWNWANARCLDNIHQHVRFFTDEYIQYALARFQSIENDTPPPPSPREIRRIERALYRFELYCNLFQNRFKTNKTIVRAVEQGELFFEWLSPWENEQLACIHDYLSHKIDPAYRDMATHDIEWGDAHVPPYDDYRLDTMVYKDYILSKGLDFLHQLVLSKTYEERKKLLSPLGTHRDFLGWGLLSYIFDAATLKDLSDWPEDEIKSLKDKYLTSDAEKGPYHAWYWAHEGLNSETFINYPGHLSLRKQGYVMWDTWRLQKSGLFDEPYVDIGMNSIYETMISDKVFLEMEKSWEKREEIYDAGGSGWWSEDDGSKVVWQTNGDKVAIRQTTSDKAS